MSFTTMFYLATKETEALLESLREAEIYFMTSCLFPWLACALFTLGDVIFYTFASVISVVSTLGQSTFLIVAAVLDVFRVSVLKVRVIYSS